MTDLPNTVTIESLNELISKSSVSYTNPIGTLTHCVITLPCGFTVTGESACVDPKKYDKAEGEKWALEKSKSSLWMLEGYLLANDRYRAEQAVKEYKSAADSVKAKFSRKEIEDMYKSSPIELPKGDA